MKNDKLLKSRNLLSLILGDENVDYYNKGQIEILIILLEKIYKNKIKEDSKYF